MIMLRSTDHHHQQWIDQRVPLVGWLVWNLSGGQELMDLVKDHNTLYETKKILDTDTLYIFNSKDTKFLGTSLPNFLAQQLKSKICLLRFGCYCCCIKIWCHRWFVHSLLISVSDDNSNIWPCFLLHVCTLVNYWYWKMNWNVNMFEQNEV
jgi:hypothetical protein